MTHRDLPHTDASQLQALRLSLSPVHCVQLLLQPCELEPVPYYQQCSVSVVPLLVPTTSPLNNSTRLKHTQLSCTVASNTQYQNLLSNYHPCSKGGIVFRSVCLWFACLSVNTITPEPLEISSCIFTASSYDQKPKRADKFENGCIWEHRHYCETIPPLLHSLGIGSKYASPTC